MPEVEFELVDVSTWRTPAGKGFEASPEEREKILRASCDTISRITPVKINEFGPKGGFGTRMLVVLANRVPMTVFFYKVHRELGPNAKSHITFHHISRRGAIQRFARQMGNSPSRALFAWMRKRVKGPAVLYSAPSPTGLRFIERLEKEGVLVAHNVCAGKRRAYNITKKPLKALGTRKPH